MVYGATRLSLHKIISYRLHCIVIKTLVNYLLTMLGIVSIYEAGSRLLNREKLVELEK